MWRNVNVWCVGLEKIIEWCWCKLKGYLSIYLSHWLPTCYARDDIDMTFPILLVRFAFISQYKYNNIYIYTIIFYFIVSSFSFLSFSSFMLCCGIYFTSLKYMSSFYLFLFLQERFLFIKSEMGLGKRTCTNHSTKCLNLRTKLGFDYVVLFRLFLEYF